MSKGSEESLPKWAQQRIASLKSSVEYWKKQVFQEASGPVDSDVFIIDGIEQRPLPKDSRILFVLPNGAEIGVHHSHGHSGEGELEIMARNDEVRVRPRASNVVLIECSSPTNIRRKS